MKKLAFGLVMLAAFSAFAQRFSFRPFNTVVEMLQAMPNDLNTNAFCAGLYAPGDKNGGQFQWLAGDSSATNANEVFESLAVGAPAGRWTRIYHLKSPEIFPGVTNYTSVVVPDKAGLQNIDINSGIQGVDVQGKYTTGDGWEGRFFLDKTYTGAADDAFNVAPNVGAGMWRRLVPAPLLQVPVTWFDPNVTNGTIQAAIDYLAALNTNAVAGREVLLPPRFMEINGNQGIHLKTGVGLTGQAGAVLSASADTTAGYRMIVADGVTNSRVQNFELYGLASVAGYGIFVTNSDHVISGGITFGTNFTTAPLYITNSSAVSVFDQTWIQNSVKGYGAHGNFQTDDTVPINMATYNTARAGGGEVYFPFPGRYPINGVVSNVFGVAWVGIGYPGSGATNAFLVPFNPNLPVLTLGDASCSSYVVRSFQLRNLTLDWRGPTYQPGVTNTYGQIGLSAVGGVYELSLVNGNVQGFALHNIEFIGGTAAATTVINLENWNVALTSDSMTDFTRGLYARYRVSGVNPNGYVTHIGVHGGHWNGAAKGFLIELDGVESKWFGTYIDGVWNHIVRLTNSASFPHPTFAGYYVNLDGSTDPARSGRFNLYTVNTQPEPGDWINFNGSLQIFTNGVPIPTNHVAIGATVNDTAANLRLNIENTWVAGGDWGINSATIRSNTTVMVHTTNSVATNSVSGAWGYTSYLGSSHAIENDQINVIPWTGIEGHPIRTSGAVEWAGTTRDFMPFQSMDTNMIYYPVVYGSITWNAPGDYRPLKNTFISPNSDESLLIRATNSVKLSVNGGGSIYAMADDAPNLFLYEVMPSIGWTAHLHFTNQPAVGDSFGFNGNRKFFTNAAPGWTNHVLLGATFMDTASNLMVNISNTFVFAGVADIDSTTLEDPATVSVHSTGAVFSVNYAGAPLWGYLNVTPYSAARWLQHDGTTYFAPGGDFRQYDQTFSSNSFYITTNARGSSLTINSNGVGILTQDPRLGFQILSQPSQASSTAWGSASTQSRTNGSVTLVALQGIAQPDFGAIPAHPVNPALSTLYIQGGTATTGDNYSGTPGLIPLRLGLLHRGSGTVSHGFPLYIESISTNGGLGGPITEGGGIDIGDQVIAGANFSIRTGRGRMKLGVDSFELSQVQNLTLAAGDTITPAAPTIQVGGMGAPVTMISTPTIVDGNPGQTIVIVCTGQSVTFQDRGTLSDSNIELGTGVTDRTLNQGDAMELRWGSTLGYWYVVK